MRKKFIGLIRGLKKSLVLPPLAKAELNKDLFHSLVSDPGIDNAVRESITWLCRAQDYSISKDGGVARHLSVVTGWSSSYPETTGYIIPTMIEYSRRYGDQTVINRAKKMLDWLVSIQFPNGGFQGGLVDAEPAVPVTFNTGQILIGLAAGVKAFGDRYLEPMCRAADWLVKTQDPDGCWRKHPTPFAKPGEKAYETHVSWGLLEAARIEPDKPYADAALANVKWAISFQHENGWFDKCCLSDPFQPLTHTIAYVLRGIIEAYLFKKDVSLLHVCQRTANGMLPAIHENGFLPGRLYHDWKGAVKWACLTGSVQMAHCYLLLYKETNENKYLEAGLALNSFVRRTIRIDGPLEIRGGVKGSFPINGDYGKYEFLNWACKFFIDSNMLEQEVS